MKNELKTLKDIFKEEWKLIFKPTEMCENINLDREKNAFYQELKAEAVKWVKEFDGLGGKSAIKIFKDEKIAENNPNGKQYFKNENEMWLTSKIIFIINFFNLTEEDLK